MHKHHHPQPTPALQLYVNPLPLLDDEFDAYSLEALEPIDSIDHAVIHHPDDESWDDMDIAA